MLKTTATLFGAAWLILFLVIKTGHLTWDNKLLWAPPILLMGATMIGLGGWDHDEDRAALLLLAALSFCSVLGYGVFYFFLFGLVGR